MKHVLAFVLLTMAAAQPLPPIWEADFPPQDGSLSWMLSAVLRQLNAAERKTRAPADVDTVRALAEAEDFGGALASLRLIVEAHPERMAAAFDAVRDHVYLLRGDQAHIVQQRAVLEQILADARKRLASFPREHAATTEYAVIGIDNWFSAEEDEVARRLRRFIEQYRGTDAALLAEVDLIVYQRGDEPRMIQALEAFVARHPGTTAAAKAVFQKGFEYSSTNMLEYEPRGADPIRRFELVVAAARDLESGRYPDSEWTRKAPELLEQFYIPQDARISRDSREQMIGVFETFARARIDRVVAADDVQTSENVIPYPLSRLYGHTEDGAAREDAFLAILERSPETKAIVRMLQGSRYLQNPGSENPDQRRARLATAKAAFRDAADVGTATRNRRALATVAAMEFEAGDCDAARGTLREYLDRYPGTPWSWVAWMRIGQCAEASGRPAAAIDAFRRGAEAGKGLPVAKALGHAYAGRVLESTGAIESAREAYARASNSWDYRYGPVYSTYVRVPANPGDPFSLGPDTAEVAKVWLVNRVARLGEALTTPGGNLLAQARALLERGRFEAAEETANRFLTAHADSALAAEARYVANLARLEQALALANLERPGHDRARAAQLLDQLSTEAPDFAVTAARIARATLRWTEGVDRGAQERELLAALTDLRARQTIREPAPGLEEDVAAIRRAVFLPRGGGIYDTVTRRWNAFEWSESSTPFLIVNADVQVKLFDGQVHRVTLAQQLADAGKIAFMDTEQIALLKRTISALGGTRRNEPTHIMETPNQPAGDARAIITMWSKLFPARPGHWGGWELETYPVITEIHFTNAERTTASAKVTIGYSGGTVELEKQAGRWIARRVVGLWIT